MNTIFALKLLAALYAQGLLNTATYKEAVSRYCNT